MMTVTMATSSCFQSEADVSIDPVVCRCVGIVNAINVWSKLLGSLLITGVGHGINLVD